MLTTGYPCARGEGRDRFCPLLLKGLLDTNQASAPNTNMNMQLDMSKSDGSGLGIVRADGYIDLLSLFTGDLSDKIFSYASNEELCTLDALNHQFKALTTDPWKRITYARFGLKNGKDDWRFAVSFLREPVFIHLDSTPEHDNMHYPGSPHVTTHNSLIAVLTDDDQPGDSTEAPFGINLYDADSLSHIGTRESLGWRVTMAGPPGDELFVVNTDSVLLEYSRAGYDFIQREIFPRNRQDEIPVIGSETHVIFVARNTLHLKRLAISVEEQTFVTSCQSICLSRQNINGWFNNSIAWGQDCTTEFVIHHSSVEVSELSVWSLNAEYNQVFRSQTIEVEDLCLNQVALADEYIIGASNDKKIHIWDRTAGQKKPFVLCDVGGDDELDEDEIIYDLRLWCRGYILITTSHIGCALCVYNTKTGQLLRRLNNAEEERYVDMLPYGMDVTSMAYLS
eukprot:scaffold7328_cov114-Cyclotella_meneghiniana.AAC.3